MADWVRKHCDHCDQEVLKARQRTVRRDNRDAAAWNLDGTQHGCRAQKRARYRGKPEPGFGAGRNPR
jgi:hypothetical protein